MQLAAKDKNELKESAAAKQMAPKPTKTPPIQSRAQQDLNSSIYGRAYREHKLAHTQRRIYFNGAEPINYGAFT